MFIFSYIIPRLVDGFIGALGSDIYQSTKDLMLKQIAPTLSYVQTAFIIAGFGLILYDVLVKDRRERERRRERIRKMENGEPDTE